MPAEALDLRVPVRHPRTASRVFSGEAVVISPAENMVRMFNTVGSRIWELADGKHSAEAIAQVLVSEFDVESDEARRSVACFLDELLAKGLIEIQRSEPPGETGN